MPLFTLPRLTGHSSQPFRFLDPGELCDRDLRLHLRETAPANADRAPTYRFNMLRQPNRENMGSIELRVGNFADLLRYTGHIGYRVEPAYRGARYAARGCQLLFGLARSHGFTELWITCDPDNAASFRTCQLVGGELIETVPVPKNHAYYQAGSRAKCRFLIRL